MSQASTIFAPMPGGLRLGLGGAPLGNMFRALSEADAQAVLEAALLDGCVTFDTAPHYGHGLSEQRFGRAGCSVRQAAGSPRGRPVAACAADPGRPARH